MSTGLSERLKQRRFESASQKSILNVMVTSSWLVGEMANVMSDFGITPAQYNVLRILRGSHPDALTCSEIGLRLIDRTPDVTRLLERLERRGLARRERATYDRRVVEVTISGEGLALLKRMDPVIEERTRRLTGSLSDAEHEQLSLLLDRLRNSVQSTDG